MFYNICKMYVNGIIRHKILGSTPTSGTTSFSRIFTHFTPAQMPFFRRNTDFFNFSRFLICIFPRWLYIKDITKTYGVVAQLARAIRSHRIGRGFDSHLLHHL